MDYKHMSLIRKTVENIFESTFKMFGFHYEKVEDTFSGMSNLIYHVFFGHSISMRIEWDPEQYEKFYYRVYETDSPTIKRSMSGGVINVTELRDILVKLEGVEKEDSEKYPEYFV